MDFTIKPIVTEKATRLTDKLNRYTFRVSPEANKHQIKDMVEKLYGCGARQKQVALDKERSAPRQDRCLQEGIHHRG